MQQPLTFIAAFIVVLALIGLAAWLVRRFAGNNLGSSAARGRMPRLAVIDAAAVDGRRRLVLVRRDNIEHLLMIGGPTDLVVELNIVRAMPARDGAPQRPGQPGDLARAPALPDSTGWSDNDSRPDDLDAADDTQPRRLQPSLAEETRRPLVERRGAEATALAPDLPSSRSDAPRTDTRVDPGMPRPPRPPRPNGAPRPRLAETLSRLPRGPEPTPPVTPAASPSVASDAEKELTDMAQRLEAALRRPSVPPVTPPVAAAETVQAPTSAPPVEPPRPPRPAATSSAPPVAPPDAPSSSAAPAGRPGFENLEDEMASLLGRPKSPT